MAKNMEQQEMVSVPAETLRQLQARLDALELAAHRDAMARAELANPKAKVILDQAWEEEKKELAKPAAVRTQEKADKLYGIEAPRFRVRLDSTTDDGKPGPNVSEWPEIVLSAHSDLEAKGRYTELCGIRKHDYRLVVTAA